MGLDFLQTHEHLYYLFKLSCLCLTSVSPRYPAVVMGKVDTQGLQSRIVEVVLPCQRYLSEVSDSLALCCTDVSLEKFSLLSSLHSGNLDSVPIMIPGYMWITSGVRPFTSPSCLPIGLFFLGQERVVRMLLQLMFPL